VKRLTTDGSVRALGVGGRDHEAPVSSLLYSRATCWFSVASRILGMLVSLPGSVISRPPAVPPDFYAQLVLQLADQRVPGTGRGGDAAARVRTRPATSLNYTIS
jgi:hypothetical protein